MATVVQVERLRDQVYRLIRDDLKSGALRPGQRIVEGDLAERYSVSRTPVREALFQVARDGLLESGGERGYIVAVDTPLSTVHRHEVRDLLDPQLAAHAAADGSPEQRKALAKAHERQCAAHEANRLPAFITANMDFRTALRAMCRNAMLAQCSALVDDQAQSTRRMAFAHADYRQFEIDASARLVTAIVAGEADTARTEMRDYIEAVRHLPADIIED
jgi:DNA-binding GntR family transcriptional regulator